MDSGTTTAFRRVLNNEIKGYFITVHAYDQVYYSINDNIFPNVWLLCYNFKNDIYYYSISDNLFPKVWNLRINLNNYSVNNNINSFTYIFL